MLPVPNFCNGDGEGPKSDSSGTASNRSTGVVSECLLKASGVVVFKMERRSDGPLGPGLAKASASVCDPPWNGVVSDLLEDSYGFAVNGLPTEYFLAVGLSGNDMAEGEVGIGGISFEDSGSGVSGNGVGTLSATGVNSDTGLRAVADMKISGMDRREPGE